MDDTDKFPKFDDPWSLGDEKYEKVFNIVKKYKCKKILEFGSGVSTLKLSYDFPKSFIHSIESDIKYLKRTQNLLTNYNVNNVSLLHFPLTFVRYDARVFLTYSIDFTLLDSKYDFILIDGPVESITIQGREGVLYNIFNLISNGGIIALDDYHRQNAKKTCRNWLKTYKDQIVILEESSDILFMQKINSVKKTKFPDSHLLFENWKNLLQLIIKKLKYKINKTT